MNIRTFDVLEKGNGIVLYLSSYATDEKENILLTWDCVTGSEVDYVIDELIKELEYARKKAKRLLIKNRRRLENVT